MADVAIETRDARGEWQPPKKIISSVWFQWPPKPIAILKRLFGKGGMLWRIYAAVAILFWFFLTPSMERMASLSFDWIALIFLRNALFLTLVAGTLHLRLYVRRAQEKRYKYNEKWLSTHNKKFLFKNQALDNAFFSLASGCTVWTGYEVLTLWAYANGWLPYVDIRTHPVYFVLLWIGILFFRQIHFYWTHRFIHWKPLYKLAHYLHHKNVNIGPWSGLSMHPIEHLIYFSGVFIHSIVPSHPLHAIYHLTSVALAPAKGHSGFDKIVVGGEAGTENERIMGGADFFHYLHHKYFTVNFGNQDMAFDKWFGSYHDGSEESQAAMRIRRRRSKSDGSKARQSQPE